MKRAVEEKGEREHVERAGESRWDGGGGEKSEKSKMTDRGKQTKKVG